MKNFNMILQRGDGNGNVITGYLEEMNGRCVSSMIRDYRDFYGFDDDVEVITSFT